MGQRLSRLVTVVYAAGVVLLVIWGAWLLATRDPDGGRHPVGGALLVAGLVFTVLGLVSLRRSSRRRPRSARRRS